MGEAMSELALSDKVDALESLILQVPQVDLQTKHELSGGVYARTILIPAGTVLTGSIRGQVLECTSESVAHG